MFDNLRSSVAPSNTRMMSGSNSSVAGSYYFRSRNPILTFDERCRLSRPCFADASQTTETPTRRLYNTEAAVGYNYLHLRGFLVHGCLDPSDPSLDDVLRIIDSIGWLYTVLHVNPFCPNVVREFISNKPYSENGAIIRGKFFRFTPSVINRSMLTPCLSVSNSFEWSCVDLNHCISYLTGQQCLSWRGFNLNTLLKPYQTLYWVCELNWISGPYSESLMQERLRLVNAVAKQKQISFGHLVYDQVIDMVRLTQTQAEIIFPNLIYNVLLLQKNVPLLPVDEEPIGKGIPIYAHEGDTRGPRGSRRLY